MLRQQEIVDFCNNHIYDIRKSGNGRWIDQKCACDVVSVISDCIYHYELAHPGQMFSTPDIWHDAYAVENVECIFKKPGVEQAAAKNEYDKFFQQPMELLAYAGVLSKTKNGGRNVYRVEHIAVLEYIALREKNALFFLKSYIEKVLTDSGMLDAFQQFFARQTKAAYECVKKQFSEFTITYTSINGEVECNRIFIKVLNPLAYYQNAYGTQRGHLSKDRITYDMLMYNRNNFRDVFADKPKAVTRKEFAKSHPSKANASYYAYQSAKAKRYLKLFNHQVRDGKTEHFELRHTADDATHIHHIFGEAEYPEICFYLENLIALTPTQHLNYAHPRGRTQEIDEQYQHLLLLSKANRIRDNLTDETVETIYEFSCFLFVLRIGLEREDILSISDMDFDGVVHAINVHYQGFSL